MARSGANCVSVGDIRATSIREEDSSGNYVEGEGDAYQVSSLVID